jgi:hypothetical protein
MCQYGGEDHEAEQGQRGQAGPKPQQDHQPGADLTEERERQEKSWRRQVRRRDLRGATRGIA